MNLRGNLMPDTFKHQISALWIPAHSFFIGPTVIINIHMGKVGCLVPVMMMIVLFTLQFRV